jgi:hypothetical protein
MCLTGAGITTLHPDGRQSTLLAVDGPPDLKPNGIALMDDGGFLIANLGRLAVSGRWMRRGMSRPFSRPSTATRCLPPIL